MDCHDEHLSTFPNFVLKMDVDGIEYLLTFPPRILSDFLSLCSIPPSIKTDSDNT